MELTETARELIACLKLFEATEEDIIGICLLLKQEKQQEQMLYWMADNPNATMSETRHQAFEIAGI